jgi:SWI/SNF-related matrix-associated actin-dependent regulator 1 of chromatin subfamily A
MLSPSAKSYNLLPLEAQARGYQRWDAHQALDVLLTRRAVLLGHEPGLGKTLITLIMAVHLGARRILIVCPAVARLVWDKEIATWLPRWVNRLVIVRPGERPADLAQRLAGKNAICVLSYDLFGTIDGFTDHALDDLIRGDARFDLAIFDEAHYLKSMGAGRTQQIYGPKGVAARSSSVVLLSGTICPNGAQELWTHLATLWPDLIQIQSRHGTRRPMTESEWTERVCVMRYGKFGPRYIGNRNATMVRKALDQIMIRRTKREVLPELPSVLARDIPLDLDIKRVFARMTPETRRLHNKLATMLMQKRSDDEVLRMLRLPSGHPDQPVLASLRRQLAEIKLAAAVEWAAPRLDDNHKAKFVFFGWHTGALEKLHATMAQYNSVILTGDTRDKDRAAAIERFQTDPHCRVFVGQIKACGMAVTLTAGTECVFLECAWTPGDNTQVISRLHRMGKKESVLASFLYAPGTIDETVMRVFRKKANDLRQFIRD